MEMKKGVKSNLHSLKEEYERRNDIMEKQEYVYVHEDTETCYIEISKSQDSFGDVGVLVSLVDGTFLHWGHPWFYFESKGNIIIELFKKDRYMKFRMSLVPRMSWLRKLIRTQDKVIITATEKMDTSIDVNAPKIVIFPNALVDRYWCINSPYENKEFTEFIDAIDFDDFTPRYVRTCLPDSDRSTGNETENVSHIN